MAVESKFFSTLDRNQETPRMFDAKSDAVAYDLYLEAVYAMAEIILQSKIVTEEAQADQLAEMLVAERERYLPALKKVPVPKQDS